MEVNVTPVQPGKARKRSRNPEQWKRAKEKVSRYSPKQLPEAPTCTHRSGRFKCTTLTMADMKKFHDGYYSSKKKYDQDAFLLKYALSKPVKRRRPRTGTRRSQDYQTKLYIKRCNSVKLVPVCKKTFVSVLHVSPYRINNVVKHFAKTGLAVKEKRGGDRISHKNIDKRKAVKAFIQKFKCIESHYCRSSTSVRRYLPAVLNIKKMWTMYNNEQAVESLKVKQCYFRNIFNREYNIGFGKPRTDTCSKCTELDHKIKTTRDLSEKNKFMMEKRLHTLKYKRFYKLLKEVKEGMQTFSFDCQKNQVLPKVSDQAAYYSRQLYQYNFGIVRTAPQEESEKLSKKHVFLYIWKEDEHRKGANEIASAVHHMLTHVTLDVHVNTIRLVADGCGAQNKNSVMVGMLATWLSTEAPAHVKIIELVFPVPGHSFLPPDRVFGNIEQELKKIEVIIKPEEYETVFKNHGTVINFRNVMDWKFSLSEVIRPPGSWHFKFALCKRFFIKKTRNLSAVVRGEPHYTMDIGEFKSILRKGKSFADVHPDAIEEKKVILNRLKLNDVDKLLKKHFGPQWNSNQELSYYDEVIKRAETYIREDDNDEEACEPAEPDNDLFV